MLHLFSNHSAHFFNQGCIPGLCQHGSHWNCRTVLVVSVARKLSRTIVEKSAFQTEFKWHGNDLSFIYIVIFHKAKPSRAICKNNTCQTFVNSTPMCLTCGAWYGNSGCSQVSTLCFSRITGSQINKLFNRKSIYKFHCLRCSQFTVLTVYNFLCLKLSCFQFQNRKLL